MLLASSPPPPLLSSQLKYTAPLFHSHGNWPFGRFSFKLKKFIAIDWFIVANFVNPWTFIIICCKLFEIWEPEIAKIYKEMYAGGVCVCRGAIFARVCNRLLWNSTGLLNSVRKIDLWRWILNFCFNEKWWKLQLCVTSVKRSVNGPVGRTLDRAFHWINISQWINVRETNWATRWIEIYPVDGAIWF